MIFWYFSYCFHVELNAFLSRPNKLCEDDQDGFETLETLEDCKMASNYLPKQFSGEVIDSLYPKGCYFSTYELKVYYNSHASGNRNFNSRHICRAKGKQPTK